MQLRIALLVGFLLAAFSVAATDTNDVAKLTRQSLGPHQLFYTNWSRMYFASRALVSTNQAMALRQRQLVDRVNIGIDSPQLQSERARLRQIETAIRPSEERYNQLIAQRLAYESKYPSAIQFAPRIRNWQSYPTLDLKD